MRVHHIGYLVRRLEKAVRRFEQLGYTAKGAPVYDEGRRVNIQFLEKDGYLVELVASAAPDSVVAGLYQRFRNAPYHLCYAADSFEEELARLCQNGYVQMGEPAPAPAFGGRRVVFLLSAEIGMIELVEE